MGKYLKEQYEIQDILKDNKDLKLLNKYQKKLLKETDVLLKTFWKLATSTKKQILFKDCYRNHSFLSNAESLHNRIKIELTKKEIK